MKKRCLNYTVVKSLITFLLLVHFLSASTFVKAKVQLPSILSSNMVLQQHTNVKLWGKAQKNSPITIKTSWDNKTYKTIADKQGKWLLNISTPVAGGPYEITFNDGELLTLKNILIGEVWFCSGQSNMEMPMSGFDRQPTQGTNDVIAKAKASTPIRIYNTDSKDGKWIRQFSKTPEEDCKGEWLENTPVNVSHTSATAYFFAQYLQEVLEVPVGIIISSLGGSKVEAWMSREAITPFKSYYGNCTDRLKDIFKEKYDKIFAVELGLSSDTYLADMISELEDKTFVTNSDAHSLPKIAREYNKIQMEDISFKELVKALKNEDGRKIVANYGLDPKLGKYHRTYCDACNSTIQTKEPVEVCPYCGSSKVTFGVFDRIELIKDKKESVSPKSRPDYIYQTPLGFVPGLGNKTIEKLLDNFGTEMNILHKLSFDDIEAVVGTKLATIIDESRKGRLQIEAGGGGNYGKVSTKTLDN